jgi:hypothetical protein
MVNCKYRIFLYRFQDENSDTGMNYDEESISTILQEQQQYIINNTNNDKRVFIVHKSNTGKHNSLATTESPCVLFGVAAPPRERLHLERTPEIDWTSLEDVDMPPMLVLEEE